MKKLILFLILNCLAIEYIIGQNSFLQKQGTATQLVVHGMPFLILGGELGNSSAACPQDIERIFPKLKKMGLNTVLVPVYWDLTEPVEGQFDFTLTDKALQQARENDLKIVFLWFGAWKNSMSCYAPLWFKENHKKYPRAYTQSGKPLEIASAFSEAVYEADHHAFSQWMQHIATVDKEEGTVIMIQIENEIGMLEDARDYSREANKIFNAPVPAEFMTYLQKNKKALHPQMLKKWESQGCKKQGNWQEVFGADIYTDEIFMAWHYAKYVEGLAQTARSIYNIPLYVNAAMNSRGRKPGEYPSAGPLAHLIDVWHCGAPSIDILAPDLYDNGFTDWVAQYKLHNNPLFIPEIRLTDNNSVRAFYIFGEHDAIGISPFSIEDGSDSPNSPLVQSYAKLTELMPLLTKYQGKGLMKGLLFDSENKERIIADDDLTITARHFFTLPWDPRATNGSIWPEGGGILLKLSKNEYIVAGSGIVLEFAKTSEKQTIEKQKQLGEDGFALRNDQIKTKHDKFKGMRCGIGYVDEVKVDKDGKLHYVRRLNGDQDHQGRHVRISVGDFKILHVQLYEYQ
ncbi:GH35 family beta-galactosidase [Bacteroides eggerthii]|jgi:hypothetical protein|uniref:GH35 family beta-galactosidase n=1 Tax=Bacteroides eggerthii TaxID=28111 RepID=UPI000E479EFA|nr:DUF5597 domain-containing protein [Bacteroides eggerthii]RHJ40603.1 hypothetical protein DW130_08350 [Bacteroides eggerthii]